LINLLLGSGDRAAMLPEIHEFGATPRATVSKLGRKGPDCVAARRRPILSQPRLRAVVDSVWPGALSSNTEGGILMNANAAPL